MHNPIYFIWYTFILVNSTALLTIYFCTHSQSKGNIAHSIYMGNINNVDYIVMQCTQ